MTLLGMMGVCSLMGVDEGGHVHIKKKKKKKEVYVLLPTAFQGLHFLGKLNRLFGGSEVCGHGLWFPALSLLMCGLGQVPVA